MTSAFAQRRSINPTNANASVGLGPPPRAVCRIFCGCLRALETGNPSSRAPARSRLGHRPLGLRRDQVAPSNSSGADFLGRADWPNFGRRRCRHFRRPEAAEEADRRPSWVREAPRCREQRRRPAGKLRRKASQREKSSWAQAPPPQPTPWSAPASRGGLSCAPPPAHPPPPSLQGPPAALCGGPGAEIRGATGGGVGEDEGVPARGAP